MIGKIKINCHFDKILEIARFNSLPTFLAVQHSVNGTFDFLLAQECYCVSHDPS